MQLIILKLGNKAFLLTYISCAGAPALAYSLLRCCSCNRIAIHMHQ